MRREHKLLEPDTVELAARLARRVEGVATVENTIATETSVSGRVRPAAERLVDRLTGVLRLLPLVAIAVLIVALFLLAGSWLARRAWPWDRLAPNSFIADLLRQVVRLVFAGVGVLIALDLLGAFRGALAP